MTLPTALFTGSFFLFRILLFGTLIVVFVKVLILLVLIGSISLLLLNSTRPFSTRAAITYDSGWGSLGSGDGEFSDPMGVAIDRTNGWVYVADVVNDRIQKFDTS